MPLAAILNATAVSGDKTDILRGQLIFASQMLIEYQARQAAHAGAQAIFIMVDQVTPIWSRMVDRLIGEGLDVHLMRDMASLVRLFPRDSDALLFADGMVVDQRYVSELGKAEGDALLVVDDDAATAHLERIDAVHRWAGVARMTPQTLFNTLDLIGDWDLALTLLRAIVQKQPARIVVERSDVLEGRLALVENQQTADLVGKSLSRPVNSDHAVVGVEAYTLDPIARMVSMRLLRQQMSAGHIRWGAGAVALGGLAALVPGWNLVALLLFLLALFADMVAGHIVSMTRMGAAHGWMRFLVPALVLCGVALLGYWSGARFDGLYLALIAALALLILDREKARPIPAWAYVSSGTICLILLAGIITAKLVIAYTVVTLLAIVSLGAMTLKRLGR